MPSWKEICVGHIHQFNQQNVQWEESMTMKKWTEWKDMCSVLERMINDYYQGRTANLASLVPTKREISE